MDFAVVGLSLSHPYIFTDILIRKGHRAAFVWDEDLARAHEFGERFKAEVVQNYQEILCKKIDCVFIETRSKLHCKYAAPFIKRGIPVFIDKILTMDKNKLEEILNLAKERGALLMSSSAIGYRREYIKLKEYIKNGKLGNVISAFADVRHDMISYLSSPNAWQDEINESGGEIMNFGIHAVEPIFSILGPGVEWVQCFRDKVVYKECKSEDLAVINLKFKSGAIGIVNVVSCTVDYGFSLRVYGTRGVYEVGDSIGRDNVLEGEDIYGYESMMDEFIKAIENRHIPVQYSQLEELIKVMIASRISSEENRRIYIHELY